MGLPWARARPPTTPSAGRALLRGLLRRCPRCGRGGLFRRWFDLPERCPRCGLAFEGEEGAFLGSLSLNYGFTGVLFIAGLVLTMALTSPDPNWWLVGGVSAGICVIVPLAFYPFAKMLWAAVDMLLRSERDRSSGSGRTGSPADPTG